MKKTIGIATLTLITSCGSSHLDFPSTDKIDQPAVVAPMPTAPDTATPPQDPNAGSGGSTSGGTPAPQTPPVSPTPDPTPIDPGTPVVLTDAQILAQLKLICVSLIAQFSFLNLQQYSAAINLITDLNKIKEVRDELLNMKNTYASEASILLKQLLGIVDQITPPVTPPVTPLVTPPVTPPVVNPPVTPPVVTPPTDSSSDESDSESSSEHSSESSSHKRKTSSEDSSNRGED